MKRPIKKKRALSMRERIEGVKEPRVVAVRTKLSRAGRARHLLAKEVHLPISKGKKESFLHKSRTITPKFIRSAYSELKQVDWPTRKNAWKLTGAVFIFAIFFSLLVTAVDFVLDKIFKRILLK